MTEHHDRERFEVAAGPVYAARVARQQPVTETEAEMAQHFAAILARHFFRRLYGKNFLLDPKTGEPRNLPRWQAEADSEMAGFCQRFELPAFRFVIRYEPGGLQFAVEAPARESAGPAI